MKLSEAYWKQKLEMHIVFNKDKLTRSKPLSGNSNALNLCKIDISKILNTMHIFIHNQILSMFHDLVQRPDHKYLASFSNSSFYLRNYSLNSTRYSIYTLYPSLDPSHGNFSLREKKNISIPIFSF